jgi:trk system potassium uptake protein TrkH
MNLKLIFNIIGFVLILVSFFMLLPIAVSLIYGQGDTMPLALSFLITLVSGSSIYLITQKHRKEELRHRDAFAVVTISWVAVTFFGALPFVLSGAVPSWTDAYFESMSGFTTTGASILTDIEALPNGIIFWRSLTQWIGGMGIILFAIAILPLLGTGGMQLFKAEVPEIGVDKLRPRIIDTAKSLWFIYVGLTLIVTAFYMVGGMSLFDAVCHGFTTISTGGFSTKNESIAHFQSLFIEYTASIFMFLSGISFILYFYLLRGNASKLYKSSEFRFYLTMAAIVITIMTTANIWLSTYDSFSDSFRYSVFQVISLMTGTGYTTADYTQWSSFAQMVIFTIMFFGGMIGSTTGGIKQVRILLILKQGYREMYQLIHPRAVTSLKLDEKFLTNETLGSIWGFVFLFMFVCFVAAIAMTATGVDIITSMSTVVSAMSNVGPALGDAGPAENYAFIPDAGKWILIFCMLIGRLEIYTVLILFMPHFWKK